MSVYRCPACGCLDVSYSRWHAPHCEGYVIEGLQRIEEKLDAALGLASAKRAPSARSTSVDGSKTGRSLVSEDGGDRGAFDIPAGSSSVPVTPAGGAS